MAEPPCPTETGAADAALDTPDTETEMAGLKGLSAEADVTPVEPSEKEASGALTTTVALVPVVKGLAPEPTVETEQAIEMPVKLQLC